MHDAGAAASNKGDCLAKPSVTQFTIAFTVEISGYLVVENFSVFFSIEIFGGFFLLEYSVGYCFY